MTNNPQVTPLTAEERAHIIDAVEKIRRRAGPYHWVASVLAVIICSVVSRLIATIAALEAERDTLGR